MTAWIDVLKMRHRALFDGRDWQEHVSRLNGRFGLEGPYRFTESRWPPEWFLAALPLFESGGWLAVVSLNPKEMQPEDRVWHESVHWTADEYWDYLCRVDLREWSLSEFGYRKWTYPVALLLSELTADSTVMDDFHRSYFYRVGAFEVVPYASHQYAAGTFAGMEDDPGCQFARDVALAAIANCPPAAVVANGLDSVEAVSRWLPLDSPLEEHRYESVHRPGRMLRHWQSSITLGGQVIPFAGFPFLRTQSGHNAYAEVSQLGRQIRARA